MDQLDLLNKSLHSAVCDSVFMTQLNERQYKSLNAGITKREMKDFSILAQEIADKCGPKYIESQNTALFKAKIHLKEISNQLVQKRSSFQNRMYDLTHRTSCLEEKRQILKEKMLKFNDFIKESNLKRKRAICKYNKEKAEKNQKNFELGKIKSDVILLKRKSDNLSKKVIHTKHFVDYLEEVVPVLPDGFLQNFGLDNAVNSILKRHERQNRTKFKLESQLQTTQDKFFEETKRLDNMKMQKNVDKLMYTRQINNLRSRMDFLTELNENLEVKLQKYSNRYTETKMKVASIHLGINNMLYQFEQPKSRGRKHAFDKNVNESYEAKLEEIKKLVLEKEAILSEVKLLKNCKRHNKSLKAVKKLKNSASSLNVQDKTGNFNLNKISQPLPSLCSTKISKVLHNNENLHESSVSVAESFFKSKSFTSIPVKKLQEKLFI